MKKIIIRLIVLALFSGAVYSCNEDKFLKEVPLDFYSPENSYITSANFQMAVNNLYYSLRYLVLGAAPDCRFALHYATDFAYNTSNYIPPKLGALNDYVNAMTPNNAVTPLIMWQLCYQMIRDANTIISRLEYSECEVSEQEKKIFRSESLFFRAFAYRILAELYGGVPLIVEEIKAPRRDLTRATRNEVYQQCAIDLDYAQKNLPDIDKVKDGKVSAQTCQHLLSEIYINLKEWDKAIGMASAVIDHPATGLMTTRFGSRKDDPGDVYWDLFRVNNQNRSSGNKEGLYVMQWDYLNIGSSENYTNYNWAFNPYYQALSIGGKSLFAGNTSEKGGRGAGWGRPTDYYLYKIWETDFHTDIRNSQYNIIRDLQIDNPVSPYFKKWMVKDGVAKLLGFDSTRNWFPLTMKYAPVGQFPTDHFQKNADGTLKKTALGEQLVTNSSALVCKDEYLFRLAETYLLRAEAYIGANNLTLAANDINTVRIRANATPISPTQVTIDFILDERMRELALEEFRMCTLCRLGKLVERNKMYNPLSGPRMLDYHNLWPIPYQEIERNIYGKIEQNPGYAN